MNKIERFRQRRAQRLTDKVDKLPKSVEFPIVVEVNGSACAVTAEEGARNFIKASRLYNDPKTN